MSVYGTSPVNRQRGHQARSWRAVDDAIVAAVEIEHPITLRGVFYRAVGMGAVEKTEKGYDRVGSGGLLKLRRDGDDLL